MSMIAQRLAELQQSTNRWRSQRPREILAPEIRGILSQRRTALLERQDLMDGGTTISNDAETPKEKRKTALELRKNALVESAERWRERVKTDPDLEYLSGIKRLQKDCPMKQIRPKTAALDIGKGLDRFYSSTPTVSPPSKVLQIDSNEFEGIITTTPRLVVPTRAAARGRNRRVALRRSAEPSLRPTAASTPVFPIDYRLKQISEDEDEDGLGICSSAKKGLQSKLDYSAVKLKKPELKSPYPELMLIRLKGDKNIDVRLVAPKYTSIHAYAVFILVTPKRLFLYHGKYSSLLERSKAALIATSICDKTGELGCTAKRFENVNEGKGVDEFWRLLGLEAEEDEGISEEYVPDDLLDLCEPFENAAARVNTIYEVAEDYSLQRILSTEVPKYSVLHAKKNLIFDFGSEIYVWVGRNADRVGTQQAIAYAEELRTKPLMMVSGQDQMILGDSFDKARPDWCLLVKLTQGLKDSLFQHKFRDWEMVKPSPRICSTPRRWKTTTFSPSTSPLRDEEDARTLGRSLASGELGEPVLILEETELFRNAENIFTENVRYFILEDERTLRELDELWLFRDDCCYVIKWEYRIERIGIRKLDGTEREKETGRPRVAYFYWLGAKTSKTEQGLCALALRDYDCEHFPHERIVQGQEPPLFLQLFQGSLIISGPGSGVFLVYVSSIPREARLEEQTLPVVYRAHAVYITLSDRKITILKGRESNESSQTAARKFAENIKAHFTTFEQLTSEPVIECECLTGTDNCSVIEADHWAQSPRLFRLFERDGEELTSANWDPLLPFSFRQDSFRDTIMVDQDHRLWLWSDKTVSTFALRVANAYWSGRNGPKTVICKTMEPDSFKALFARWDDFVDEIDENELVEQRPLRCEPIDLDELLRLRTRTWPLEKVIGRDLPPGTDLNRLEQYLNDDDFQSVFQMERTAFYALPHWKQIELRKKHKLF